VRKAPASRTSWILWRLPCPNNVRRERAWGLFETPSPSAQALPRCFYQGPPPSSHSCHLPECRDLVVSCLCFCFNHVLFPGVPFLSPLAVIEHRYPNIFSSDTAVLLLPSVSTSVATRQFGSFQETASHSLNLTSCSSGAILIPIAIRRSTTDTLVRHFWVEPTLLTAVGQYPQQRTAQ
jgi:hypothetical protein